LRIQRAQRFVEGEQMIVILLPITTIAFVALYLIHWQRG